MRDILEEIWATTRRNKLRTTLTGFSVAWGIFMLIVLLGAGNGLINAGEQNSRDFLDNSMSVYGGATSKAYKGLKEGREITLGSGDMTTTRERFSDNVDQVGAVVTEDSKQIVYGANYTNSQLTGVYPVYADINKREMVSGRFINDIDNDQQRRSIVIYEDMAKELSHDPIGLIGQQVKVGDFSFMVVGIMKSSQNGFNQEAYIPYTTLRTIYNKGDTIQNIMFSFHGLKTMADNEAFETRYKAAINRNHQAAPDDEDAIWIWNRFTQAMQMDNGMAMIRTALWIIGLFTLLSGIVGVSNIMLITVKERTHEFGIRKAIGARPSSILRLIIIESVIITTVFGYIGMLLGIGACQYMDTTLGHNEIDSGLFKATMFVDPTVGFSTCVAATVVMVVAGTFAGLIPARRAARIRPIEALRVE